MGLLKSFVDKIGLMLVLAVIVALLSVIAVQSSGIQEQPKTEASLKPDVLKFLAKVWFKSKANKQTKEN